MPKKYKTIQIPVEDWDELDKRRSSIERKIGVRLSMAAAIKYLATNAAKGKS